MASNLGGPCKSAISVSQDNGSLRLPGMSLTIRNELVSGRSSKWCDFDSALPISTENASSLEISLEMCSTGCRMTGSLGDIRPDILFACLLSYYYLCDVSVNGPISSLPDGKDVSFTLDCR